MLYLLIGLSYVLLCIKFNFSEVNFIDILSLIVLEIMLQQCYRGYWMQLCFFGFIVVDFYGNVLIFCRRYFYNLEICEVEMKMGEKLVNLFISIEVEVESYNYMNSINFV